MQSAQQNNTILPTTAWLHRLNKRYACSLFKNCPRILSPSRHTMRPLFDTRRDSLRVRAAYKTPWQPDGVVVTAQKLRPAQQEKLRDTDVYWSSSTISSRVLVNKYRATTVLCRMVVVRERGSERVTILYRYEKMGFHARTPKTLKLM